MDYMARALLLASRALGTVSPNPAVGAVLVRDGQVVGEGATQPPGEAHAEVVALRAAGDRARGATLYVTFEPCAHYGRTPPCADAIVEAGVGEAHVAMLDPSPWVDGHGVAVLERAGIKVRRGSHEIEARRLNEGYLTWLQAGRPLVTAVYAIGLDGQPFSISDARLGPAADAELARLRAAADRTLSDIGALLTTDPTLSGLAEAGVTALNVEVHPDWARELAVRGLLDRLVVFMLPAVRQPPAGDRDGGGERAPAPVSTSTVPSCLSTLRSVTYERLGDVLMIRGTLPDSSAVLADAQPESAPPP